MTTEKDCDPTAASLLLAALSFLAMRLLAIPVLWAGNQAFTCVRIAILRVSKLCGSMLLRLRRGRGSKTSEGEYTFTADADMRQRR